VIVVGAGPGGSWAAKHAAERGVSVLLLEKDREVGSPVRCAEGVSEKGIKEVVTLKDQWIAQTIRGGRVISPGNIVVEAYPDEKGYILHRKLFDADLAAMASQSGAEVVTKAYVHGLLKKNDAVTGVKVLHMGREYQVSGSVVIGADGVESRVGRWAGIETRTPPEKMASCVQMVLSNMDIASDMVEFYFGSQVVPGGYLWVFPKGPRTANVGLGISGFYSKHQKPILYLKKFIEARFPKASVLSLVAGGVPTMPTLKTIVGNGWMLVGDAARQANPLTGGGIVNAMIAGRIAGRVAAEAVLAGDVSSKRLSPYPKEWHTLEGKNNERSYKIKKVVDRLSDTDLDNAAQTLLDIPPEKRTALRLFKTVLFKHPKLILEASKVFV